MLKRYFTFIPIILLAGFSAFGQTIMNSPYTRFGIGEVDRNSFNHSRAMGGIATGLRVQNQINYMNPAAISAQDTMSFIFDIGLSGVSKSLESKTSSASFNNFSFDHLAIAFPIKRWWFMSLGINPYSKIGYNITQVGDYEPIDTVSAYNNNYGNGGINQIFFSNSFKIGDEFSVGINVNYIFGSIETYNQFYLDRGDSYSTVVYDKYSLSNLNFDIGAQYTKTFNEKTFITAGFVYSNKMNATAERNSAVIRAENFNLYDINVMDYLAYYKSIYDTVTTTTDNDYKIEIPARLSLGVSGGILNKLTVGIDYSYQNWADIKPLNNLDNFDYSADHSVNFGLEYIPNKFSLRQYYKKIAYRAGAYYNSTYLTLNNENINNYGITFGFGFPLGNQRTSFNVSCSLGKRGTLESNLIEENYAMFGINLTLYDFWFIKRQFQ